MGFLDEYKDKLKEKHEEAGKDFDKGETTYGKDMDDRIGYIHDCLEKLIHHFGLDKVEEDKTLQQEAIQEGTKEQETMKKEKNK